MKAFFDDSVLLRNESARILFEKVKDLPIIDYHCHLNPQMIAEDRSFSDIGEFWLAGDHYKWRAMRMCGVDEYYITGDATFKEKFLAYARIMPKMIGNPLYYWTHMELKQIFGINRPLNAESAEEIYAAANRKLADLSVQKLLRFFGVERLATTDDPVDTLEFHGKHGDTLVTPTFRPDQVYALSEAYLEKLAVAAGIEIVTLDDLLRALAARLDFFVSKGCFIADHGFERFPTHYASRELAKQLFAKRGGWSEEEQDLFFGFLLTWLMKEYKKRNITAQIHFAVTRNVNRELFAQVGPDSGLDVLSTAPDPKDLIRFLQQLPDAERPDIVLYTLNDATLTSLASVSGAFRNVRMGAAWWFNDTLNGIRRNLLTVSEYASLGTNLGMLTDSRSFSSYSRFDFFRRIVCDFVGEMVENG
ncbi:MAG: glucuronate isomerase, partial [Clostridia bacterium]|nr:glucuronate isomerase [Clostridia bacterium]